MLVSSMMLYLLYTIDVITRVYIIIYRLFTSMVTFMFLSTVFPGI